MLIFFDCKSEMRVMLAALVLSIWADVLFSQSDGIKIGPATKSYPLPKALAPFEAAISSDEFENLVGLKAQQPFSQEPLQGLPQPPSRASPNPNEWSSRPRVDSIPLPVATDPPANPIIAGNARVVDGKWTPWWQEKCAAAILSGDMSRAQGFSLEQLIWLSMENSPRVQSILITPKIQRTDIDIAKGDFDPRRVARSNYRDSSDPVGNTLTTGGPTRFDELFWENSVGIRDRNAFGGKTELSQLINSRDSNSLFFKPNHQADTKLSLNYTQPLLRGSGRYYNTSSIRLAGLKTNESIAEANKALQDHAWDVISAYWELVLQRYLLEQSRQGQLRLMEIRKQLQNRKSQDLLPTHLARAVAAISNQQAQIIRLDRAIRGLQESLRRLVNAPELDAALCNEIIPLTIPATEKIVVPLEGELIAALEHRGDIVAIQERLEQAMVQKKLAVSELRKQLDFEMEGYIRGLRGDNQLGEAFVDQFSKGPPSVAAGVTYQNPVGNRAAKAISKSRDLEIRKLQFDYSDTLKKAYADIYTAIYTAEGTYESTLASIESTLSTLEEVDGQYARFDDFMTDNPSPSNVLNDLLDAEIRLINAENAWARNQVDNMLAIMKIKYESGSLMTVTVDPVQ